MNGIAFTAWVLTAIGCGAVYILAPSPWTAALTAAVVLTPLFGAAAALLARKSVTVEVLPPRSAEKNADAEIVFRGSSRFLLPLPRVRFRCTLRNCLTGEARRLSVELSLPPRGEGETRLTLRSARCGLFRLQGEQVQVCDPFGIFRFSAADDRRWSFAVQPELFPMEVLLPLRSGVCEDSDRYAPDRPGFDFADTYQVREYAPGDSPRQLHWKLSAKLDRLIVRDPGLPLERAVLLLWERGGEPSPQESAAMAEVLATLCHALLRQGVGCRVAWNSGGDLSLLEQRDPEGFYELLPELLSAAPDDSGETAAGLYRRLCGGERGGKVVYLGPADDPELSEICPPEDLTSLLCRRDGEGQGRVYAFDCEGYAETLSEIAFY